jgi:diacylglycerol kinase family enzyme
LRRNNGAVFFNPSSGAKFPDEDRDAFKAAAAEAGLDVIQLTNDVDVIGVIRERKSKGESLFVAAGGDGTINHVVQAVVNTEAILAVIPIGTYNHFARDLGIPLDWKEALAVATDGAVRQVDAARVNDRFFVNNLSIGLYPELVARREARGRDYPRWKARLVALAGTMKSYPHVNVTIESGQHQESLRTPVLMVSNNSYDLSQMGIEASRDTLEGGELSVYWLPHVPRYQLMKFVGHYLAGKVHDAPGFRSFRTTGLKMRSRRRTIKVGIDGEVFTMATPLTIATVPSSLSVKVPKQP